MALEGTLYATKEERKTLTQMQTMCSTVVTCLLDRLVQKWQEACGKKQLLPDWT